MEVLGGPLWWCYLSSLAVLLGLCAGTLKVQNGTGVL